MPEETITTNDFFDTVAPYYDLLAGVDENNFIQAATVEYERVLRLFEYFKIPRGSIIVDAGCGTGMLCCYLGFMGYQAVGIDLSSGMIKQAMYWKERCGLRNVEFVQADIADVAAMDERARIGCVYSREMIPYIKTESALSSIVSKLFETCPVKGICFIETLTEQGMRMLLSPAEVSFDNGTRYSQQSSYEPEVKAVSLSCTLRFPEGGPSDLGMKSRLYCWDSATIERLLVAVGFRKIEFFDSMVDVSYVNDLPVVGIRPVNELSESIIVKAERI